MDSETGGAHAADPASSLPIDWMEFVVVGDQAYFVTQGLRPGELWRTDGTAEGTVLVTDRFATKREDPITEMTAIGDELYFAAEDRRTGVELWRTDGTDSGTSLVADLSPGEGRSYPKSMVPLGEHVLFWADGAEEGCGLWRTDGTPEGTELVSGTEALGLRPRDGLCPYPDTAMRMGDGVVLSFDTGSRFHQVWRSDGTAPGTVLLRSFPERTNTEWVLAGDGMAYFAADDGAHGRELWRTDGTVEGTALVADLATGPAGSDPEPVAAVGDLAFFFARAPSGGRALWSTDGTADGTRVIKRLKPNWQYDFEAGDTLLYFWADDGTHGSELWRSDGTRQGTRMVRDIARGRKSAGPQGYSDIATIGDLAVFAAQDRQHGIELWVSNGTRKGTRLIADTAPGRGGTGPSWITRFGDLVLFSADDRIHGRELWRSDGTPDGTGLVRDISSGTPD